MTDTLLAVQSWSFGPDEFVHIWQETDLDEYPYPIRVLETPATEAEARTLRTELSERLPPQADPDLSDALAIVAQPHTRIVVIGNAVEPGAEIRILAATVREHSVLVIQDPGSTADFGGSVHISTTRSAELGARIAACLPPTPPGRQTRRIAELEELQAGGTLTPTAELDVSTTTGQILALLEHPRTAEGHLRIEPRLEHPQPPEPANSSWIDVAGDGRYLIKPGPLLQVAPVQTSDIAHEIQKRIPC